MSTKPLILVGSATANTGSHAIRQLSATGKYQVRAMARNLKKAESLGALPNVTVVKGDFTDKKSLAAALKGVKRAMLISGAGSHAQYEWEVDFIKAATEAKVEGIVRVSTATCLIHPGSTGVYARAHACIEAYIDYHKSKVVDLNPNWFFDNWLGSAGEAKGTGKITWPVEGKGQTAMVDPRDVASAATTILQSDSPTFEKFLKERKVEVHGPSLTSFKEVAEALSKSVGYDIKINAIPGPAWSKIMQGFGLSELFATSFLHTIETCDGTRKPMTSAPQKSSKILLDAGWKAKYGVNDWVKSAHVLAAFKK